MEDYTPMEENRLLSDDTIPAIPTRPFTVKAEVK